MEFNNNEIYEFEVFKEIREVTISTSFKNRVLEQLEAEKVTNEVIGNAWFTPKLQIAAMIVVLLVNSLAITYAFYNQKNETLQGFQDQYISRSNSGL